MANAMAIIEAKARTGAALLPNLDRLRQELVASGELLGTEHQVTQVIKAEYEASLQQRIWSGIPRTTQLVQARTQAQDMLRSNHKATTSAQLEQLLRTRSRQISDELELLERYKWERAEISSLLETTRLEEARGRATRAQGGSSSNSAGRRRASGGGASSSRQGPGPNQLVGQERSRSPTTRAPQASSLGTSCQGGKCWGKGAYRHVKGGANQLLGGF